MEYKKDNFKRISENRTNKIIILLSQLTNLSNSSFYEYSEQDIEQMFDKITKATEEAKKYLLNSKKKEHKKKKTVF